MSCTSLCIGDQHFKKNNKKITDRLEKKSIELVEQYKPDFVVLMGDICHLHNMTEMVSYDRVINYLRNLVKATSKIGSKLFLIIGNHDRRSNRDFMTEIHFFNSLKEWSEEIYVIDKTEVHEIKGKQFCFVPYVPDGMFQKAVKDVD